jgi:Zn-dependent metalloprotease
VSGRRHERLVQLHGGLRVFGGELVRQSDSAGAVSVFGALYEGIDVDTRPNLSGEAARARVRVAGAPRLLTGKPAELLVLPLSGGGYALCWMFREWTADDFVLYFVDAHDGQVRLKLSDLKRQSAVGIGRGVLNDRKKISASSSSGTFVADDALRPPNIATYDFQGQLEKLLTLQRVEDLSPSDLARDSDNDWSDGANVDAHVYAGYTYDYYFKRFGRRGLDDANITISSITHTVNRDEIFSQPLGVIFTFYLNAFYLGDGLMVYGEGLPEGVTTTAGQYWDYLSGALDVVAHELTHGVTDYSSQLIYQNESGALNEAFSDIMATGAEFYFQQPGSGDLRADYLAGEDVVRPGGLRSLQNPASFGDPDHYSIRFTGSEDNGGVHINSSIPNHAFYLAVEGGTNRVSGLSVQGVGAANREQIEKVFYRAFTLLLPPNANFRTARAATIQSARELYQAGSAAERAVTQAWSAVGVE